MDGPSSLGKIPTVQELQSGLQGLQSIRSFVFDPSIIHCDRNNHRNTGASTHRGISNSSSSVGFGRTSAQHDGPVYEELVARPRQSAGEKKINRVRASLESLSRFRNGFRFGDVTLVIDNQTNGPGGTAAIFTASKYIIRLRTSSAWSSAVFKALFQRSARYWHWRRQRVHCCFITAYTQCKRQLDIRK